MSGLRILITNLRLEGWTGTELFARDLARGLLEAGHRPVLYSPRLGKLAAHRSRISSSARTPSSAPARCRI